MKFVKFKVINDKMYDAGDWIGKFGLRILMLSIFELKITKAIHDPYNNNIYILVL